MLPFNPLHPTIPPIRQRKRPYPEGPASFKRCTPALSTKEKARISQEQYSALARLEPAIGLVDDKKTPPTTDKTVIPMPITERFQRVTNFHTDHPKGSDKTVGCLAAPVSNAGKYLNFGRKLGRGARPVNSVSNYIHTNPPERPPALQTTPDTIGVGAKKATPEPFICGLK